MQREIIQELADAMASTSIGVGYQLTNHVARYTADAAPVTPVVVNGMDDEALLKGEQMDRGKDIVLLVTPDGPTAYTGGENVKGEYSVGFTPVAITLLHRGDEKPIEKLVQSQYVLRAVILCLAAYFAQRVTARTVHDTVIMRLANLQGGLVQDDGTGVVGAVAFRVQALDLKAQRTV